jgi:hypothetical protein
MRVGHISDDKGGGQAQGQESGGEEECEKEKMRIDI